MDLTHRLLFEDAEALVLDKPAGLAVARPKRGGDCLENRLGELKLGFARPPSIVHRLDRDTSGCLLLARNPRALKRFNAAFAEGRVEKRYWAVLEGVPEDREGRIDMPLAKRSTREAGWRMAPDPRGKPAATRWRLLAQRGGRALVEFAPETGRTHQLRVHAASGLGLPIVGDPVYGRGGDAMLLHARAIAVPRSGKEPIRAEAPLPDRFGDWKEETDAAA